MNATNLLTLAGKVEKCPLEDAQERPLFVKKFMGQDVCLPLDFTPLIVQSDYGVSTSNGANDGIRFQIYARGAAPGPGGHSVYVTNVPDDPAASAKGVKAALVAGINALAANPQLCMVHQVYINVAK